MCISSDITETTSYETRRKRKESLVHLPASPIRRHHLFPRLPVSLRYLFTLFCTSSTPFSLLISCSFSISFGGVHSLVKTSISSLFLLDLLSFSFLLLSSFVFAARRRAGKKDYVSYFFGVCCLCRETR